MKNILYINITLGLVALSIYLFATAPPPLLNKVGKEKKTFSIEEAFTIIAQLNDVARTFYTKEIVGKGLTSGFKFHEDWRKDDIEAGPLPALFLRGVASYIEKSPVPLGLYLGSDYPIVETNLFIGIQAEKFKEIRKNKSPRFFYDEGSKRYIAMFPDYAMAQACVTCHNEHKDSPKSDWKLKDMMGATTWSYPKDSVSTDELLAMINAYKSGVADIYAEYIKEVNGFKNSGIPSIGDNWPSNGYFLPSVEALNDTLTTSTSKVLLNSILSSSNEE